MKCLIVPELIGKACCLLAKRVGWKLIWIVSLYFLSSILMHLEWKKWRNHFTDCFNRRDLVWRKGVWNLPGSFWGIKQRFLRVEFFALACTYRCYSTHKDIFNYSRSASIGFHMQKLCHSEVDLPIFTPIVWEDAAPTPIIYGKGGSHMFVM